MNKWAGCRWNTRWQRLTMFTWDDWSGQEWREVNGHGGSTLLRVDGRASTGTPKVLPVIPVSLYSWPYAIPFVEYGLDLLTLFFNWKRTFLLVYGDYTRSFSDASIYTCFIHWIVSSALLFSILLCSPSYGDFNRFECSIFTLVY
jgi:hypothetical protein